MLCDSCGHSFQLHPDEAACRMQVKEPQSGIYRSCRCRTFLDPDAVSFKEWFLHKATDEQRDRARRVMPAFVEHAIMSDDDVAPYIG